MTQQQTPAYVVKKVGDEYRVVPKDALGKSEGLALFTLGAMFAYLGSLRGGFSGIVRTAAGGYLAYWAASRSCLFCKRTARHERESRRAAGPTFQHEDVTDAARDARWQRPKDEVDEMAMESFPASDAPASRQSVGDDSGVRPAGAARSDNA